MCEHRKVVEKLTRLLYESSPIDCKLSDDGEYLVYEEVKELMGRIQVFLEGAVTESIERDYRNRQDSFSEEALTTLRALLYEVKLNFGEEEVDNE